MIYKTLHRKLKIEQDTYTHTLKPKMNSDAPNVQAGSVPLVAPVMLLLSQTG